MALEFHVVSRNFDREYLSLLVRWTVSKVSDPRLLSSCQCFSQGLGLEGLRHRSSDPQVLPVHTPDDGKCVIRVDEASFGTHPGDHIGGVIHRELSELERLLRPFALGDVADKDEVIFSPVLFHVIRRDLNRVELTTPSPVHRLDGDRTRFFEPPPDLRPRFGIQGGVKIEDVDESISSGE